MTEMSISRVALSAALCMSMLSAHASAASPAASKHGWVDTPLARQTICSNQGGYWWPDDGSAIPNEACRTAFIKEKEVYPVNPQYPFTQINEYSANVADYNNMQAVMQAVPDGLLCSAGDTRKSGMDVPSPYWQTQVLDVKPDGTFTLVFHATAEHDGHFWEIYLSKPGFDPATAPLSWAQLDKIATFGNLTPNEAGDYVLDGIRLPPGHEGRAVVYTRWQRADPAGEGFYNCSDVMIPAQRARVRSGL